MPNEASLRRFIELRVQAKSGALAPSDRAEYEAAKETFAQAVCQAQGIALPPGQRARASFRVAALFKVEITSHGAIEKASTMDISGGGFSALLGAAMGRGAEVAFKLNLSMKDTISGRAVVVSATKERSGCRVAFAFSGLKESDVALLEDALFDAVLPRKMTPPPVMPSSPPVGTPPTMPSAFPPRRVSAMPPPITRPPSAAPAPPPSVLPPPRPRMKSVSEMLLDEALALGSAGAPAGASQPSKSLDEMLEDAMGEMRGSAEAARRETLPPVARPPTARPPAAGATLPPAGAGRVSGPPKPGR